MIKFSLVSCLISLLGITDLRAAEFDLASGSTNELGLDLYRQLANGNGNLCLSPYSIQTALTMTFAGAEGETRDEMTHTLHLPAENEQRVHASFASLRASLEAMAKSTTAIAAQSKKAGGPTEPITLSIANRLFAQTGFDFRDSFAELVKRFYGAPLEPLDFRKDPERQRDHINKWVAEQTRSRIRDLIPPNGIQEDTRLVLANAIYLKAPWQSEFNDGLTSPKPFRVRGTEAVDVPTMNQVKKLGYAKGDGHVAVSIPYLGGELQFLIILPDQPNGLSTMEAKLNRDTLKKFARMEEQDVDLSMPKFKFEPPTLPLKEELKTLGMKTAFDDPVTSANFDGIAPRKPNSYLAISDVYHKTFISLDEKGTEAAAATAVVMMELTARLREPQKPVKVKVDHPFFYAIQHVPSGTCLFIGRVTDPR